MYCIFFVSNVFSLQCVQLLTRFTLQKEKVYKWYVLCSKTKTKKRIKELIINMVVVCSFVFHWFWMVDNSFRSLSIDLFSHDLQILFFVVNSSTSESVINHSDSMSYWQVYWVPFLNPFWNWFQWNISILLNF